MKKRWWPAISCVLTGFLLVACSQASQSSAITELRTPAVTLTPAAKATWEQEWENTLAEAKKEEGVVLYVTSWPSETRTALTEAFKARYGIKLEFSPFGRGEVLVAKAKAEQTAGLHLTDFFGGGSTTAMNLLKPEGLLGFLEPLLILPEAKDPKYWRAGRFPFFDKDKQFIAMIANKQPYIVFNTDLIKKGEIATYKDLLKPQYKGKITLNDPGVTGSGASMMTWLAFNVWNLAEAKEFLRQLVTQQQAVILRDNRLHVESVARGKYAVGLGPEAGSMREFLQLGAPIDVVIAKEGTFVTSSQGGISASAKLAHPNPARVFLNWLLTREGQTVFAKSFATVGMRTDIATEWVHPVYLLQPDEKLFLHNEEMALRMGEMVAIGKQIIEESTK